MRVSFSAFMDKHNTYSSEDYVDQVVLGMSDPCFGPSGQNDQGDECDQGDQGDEGTEGDQSDLVDIRVTTD